MAIPLVVAIAISDSTTITPTTTTAATTATTMTSYGPYYNYDLHVSARACKRSCTHHSAT